jgi:hypothetical protein
VRQLNFQGLGFGKEKVNRKKGTVLTDRDVGILEFILDMKFASVGDVFAKFFKVNLSGEVARSNEGAIRRLQQLEKAGFLKGTHSFAERTKYYLATPKAYYAVSKLRPDAVVIKPSMVINHATFDHDKYVIEARIILENKRAASSWVSDKKLRLNSELAGGLTLGNVPDGIYLTPEGQRIAFEFELSKKAPKRYIEKVRKYVAMMRSTEDTVKVFDKVVYVVAKQLAYDQLVQETKIYGDLFEVQKFAEFFERVPDEFSTAHSY